MAELNNLGGEILSEFSYFKIHLYLVFRNLFGILFLNILNCLFIKIVQISLFEMVQTVYKKNLIMSVYTNHKTSCSYELVF